MGKIHGNWSEWNLRLTLPRSRERGVSIVEVVVVVTISLVLTTLAAPGMMRTVYRARVRGAASDLAGLIQQARILAERQNTTLPVYTGTVGTNTTGAFIGTLGSTWQTGEPDVYYQVGVTNGLASNVPTALNPGFTAEAAGTTLYFSPRGLPAKSSGSTYVLSNGVIFYLTDNHGNWGAVSVTASGRSKVWMLYRTAWK